MDTILKLRTGYTLRVSNGYTIHTVILGEKGHNSRYTVFKKNGIPLYRFNIYTGGANNIKYYYAVGNPETHSILLRFSQSPHLLLIWFPILYTGMNGYQYTSIMNGIPLETLFVDLFC